MTTLPRLPPELWQMILKFKRQNHWKKEKEKIHKLLSKTIIPSHKHTTRFVFRDYEVTYFRTPHLEITVTVRRGITQINHVLYIYVPNQDLYCHETRFYYTPTYYLN
jgi:hypothetical protein